MRPAGFFRIVKCSTPRVLLYEQYSLFGPAFSNWIEVGALYRVQPAVSAGQAIGPTPLSEPPSPLPLPLLLPPPPPLLLPLPPLLLLPPPATQLAEVTFTFAAGCALAESVE